MIAYTKPRRRQILSDLPSAGSSLLYADRMTEFAHPGALHRYGIAATPLSRIRTSCVNQTGPANGPRTDFPEPFSVDTMTTHC